MRRIQLLWFLFLSSSALASGWQNLELDASVDTRYFSVNSPNAATTLGFSGSAQLQNSWRNATRNKSFNLKLFARSDNVDRGRRDVDVRSFWFAWNRGALTLGVGAKQEFWGVTESRHLVNILNQIDAVEDVDDEELLGQPLLKIDYAAPLGNLAIYALPYFRERPRHQFSKRLALPFQVSRTSSYESDAKRQHVDLAARYALQINTLDIGVSYFHGTSREPRLRQQQGVWHDHYEQIEQFSLDAQWTSGPWLVKAELIRRSDAVETFKAQVLGVEYSLFQALGRSDIGLVVERLMDHRSEFGNATPYQDDWFAALRLAWNNMSDSTLLLGSYIDRDSNEAIWRLEFERRLGKFWSMDVTITAFDDVARSSAIWPVRRDGYASLKLTRNFSRHAR